MVIKCKNYILNKKQKVIKMIYNKRHSMVEHKIFAELYNVNINHYLNKGRATVLRAVIFVDFLGSIPGQGADNSFFNNKR